MTLGRWRVLGPLCIVTGLVTWAGAAATLDHLGGAVPPEGPYDYVVVAGAGVMPGGVPSDALEARTRLAVALWRQGAAPRLAFTGGVGDWGPAEAVVAADLAASLGVPRDVMVGEDRSTSTEENARELRARIGDAHVLIVTDRYHVLRCTRVFGRHFRDPAGIGATSPPWVRIRGSLREVLALGYYAVRGRL
jgi:uncharacterized SAM-binding protein YcdF (DUF218 family)